MIERKCQCREFDLGMTFGGVAKVLYMYLRKFKMPVSRRLGKKREKIHKDIMVDFIEACEDYVIENPTRLRMPLDLGYMQVLKHEYQGRNLKFLNKFYGDDYSITWIIHHMYKHAVLVQGAKAKKKIIDYVIRTGKKDFLKETVIGDYYYLLENKYVAGFSIARFCEGENHYTRSLPRKTFGMQQERTERKLFMS